jgi:predicted ATP-dependent serine protease
MVHLKPNYSIAYLQQEVGGIKIANTSARLALKNNVVSSFKHTFTNNIAGSVSSNCKQLDCNSSSTAISKLGLNGSTG